MISYVEAQLIKVTRADYLMEEGCMLGDSPVLPAELSLTPGAGPKAPHLGFPTQSEDYSSSSKLLIYLQRSRVELSG